MVAPADPTAEEVLGRSVSPKPAVTASSATPSASAPTWVMIVATPVPNSWALVSTTALPSTYTRARACWAGMNRGTG
jgi:hypothetical protein